MDAVSDVLQATGITILFFILIGGFFYWIRSLFKKNNSYAKYWFRYKILRKKYNTEEVSFLTEDFENGVTESELYQKIILTNKASTKKADELLFIYKQIKKLKGGIKNE